VLLLCLVRTANSKPHVWHALEVGSSELSHMAEHEVNFLLSNHQSRTHEPRNRLLKGCQRSVRMLCRPIPQHLHLHRSNHTHSKTGQIQGCVNVMPRSRTPILPCWSTKPKKWTGKLPNILSTNHLAGLGTNHWAYFERDSSMLCRRVLWPIPKERCCHGMVAKRIRNS
jgi:hypothetical protein